MLYDEFENLNLQYENLKSTYENDTFYEKELNNHNKIATFTQRVINEKINNIKNKRSLIDGLGTIIKTITGNLDAQDGVRYDKIIKNLENKEINLQHQLNYQFTINKQIMQRFNETVSDIKHNENLLLSKILKLHELVRNKITIQQDILFAKDLFNQLIILYNCILNILQDIENSVTFCKLRTLHPSIIRSNEFFAELQKISSYYKNQLPYELKYQNILEFESILEVNCKIEANRIIYFLIMPIDFEEQFELFQLLPIPTKINSEFVTVVPDIIYFLKSNNNTIKPLRNTCTSGKMYHCPHQLRTNNKADCEEEILLQSQSSSCHYTKLQLEDNNIEIIPEINQYLAVFPQQEKIIIQCKNEKEEKLLRGIFLIKEDKCKIYYNNEELLFQSISYGQPNIISNIKLTPKIEKLSNYTIKLKSLKLKELPPNPVVPVKEESLNLHIPSYWTIILYFCITIGIIFLIVKKLKSIKKNPKIQKDVKLKEDIKLREDTRLPEGASF